MMLCFFTVLAQKVDDKVKIHISITKDINGEKKTITKSYDNIEEMKNDPELLVDDYDFLFDKEGNLKMDSQYPKFNFFDDIDEEGSKHFKFKMGDEDGSLFFDHNNGDWDMIHEKLNHLLHLKLDGEGNFEFQDDVIQLKESEDGNYYFHKDGEKMEIKEFNNNDSRHFDEEGDDGAPYKKGFFIYKDEADDEHIKEMMLEMESFGMGGDLESLEKAMDITLDLKDVENGKVRVIVRKIHKIKIEDIDDVNYETLHQDKEMLDIENLAYFPNPSEGKFRLRFNAGAYPIQIKIIDLTGQEIYSEMNHGFDGFYDKDIDLIGKEPGIYFLQIIQNDKVNTKKLLIE